jgi:hypothetical protein
MSVLIAEHSGEDEGAYIMHEGMQQLGRARDEELTTEQRAAAERRLNVLRSFRVPKKPQRAAPSEDSGEL